MKAISYHYVAPNTDPSPKRGTFWTSYVQTRAPNWNPNSNTLELDRPQHNRPVALLSPSGILPSHSPDSDFDDHTEEFGARFANVTWIFYFIFLKLCRSENCVNYSCLSLDAHVCTETAVIFRHKCLQNVTF